MKFVITILFISFYVVCFSQDNEQLKKYALQLEDAFIKKDSAIINKLLHPKVQFGHSNGWVQTKSNIFSDFKRGYIEYKKIDSKDMLVDGNNKFKTVIYKTHAEGTVNNTAFNLNLHVLQVWMKNKNNWQLIGRQSAKMAN